MVTTATRPIVNRSELHRLVDVIADDKLERVLRYVSRARRDLNRVLENAPIDDEPETPEEATAVAEAREAIAAGRVVSQEEVNREFGR